MLRTLLSIRGCRSSNSWSSLSGSHSKLRQKNNRPRCAFDTSTTSFVRRYAKDAKEAAKPVKSQPNTPAKAPAQPPPPVALTEMQQRGLVESADAELKALKVTGEGENDPHDIFVHQTFGNIHQAFREFEWDDEAVKASDRIQEHLEKSKLTADQVFFPSIVHAQVAYKSLQNEHLIGPVRLRDNYIRHLLTYAMHRDLKLCKKVLKDMIKRGLRVFEEEFITATKLMAVEAQYKTLSYDPANLFNFMEHITTKYRASVGLSYYSYAISLFTKIGFPAMSVVYYERYLLQLSIDADPIIYIDSPSIHRQILPILISIGKFDQAEQILARIDMRNSAVYQFLIVLFDAVPTFDLSHPGHYDYCTKQIFQFFEEMLVNDFEPNADVCELVFSRAVQADEYALSLRIFLYMCGQEMPISSEIVCGLIDFIGKRIDYEELKHLLTEQRDYVTLEAGDWMYLIKRLMKFRYLDAALEVVFQVLEIGMDIETLPFMVVFTHCIASGNYRTAKRLYTELAKLNIPLPQHDIDFIKSELQRAGYNVDELMKNQNVKTLDADSEEERDPLSGVTLDDDIAMEVSKKRVVEAEEDEEGDGLTLDDIEAAEADEKGRW